MATSEQLIQKLIDTLDSAVEEMNSSIPAIEEQITKEIEQLLKGLDVKGDTLKSTAANLKKIAGFKDKIISILNDSGYASQVGDFLAAFTAVAEIQNRYFESIDKKFTPPKVVAEIQKQSIASTLEDLTESGINQNFIKPITDILNQNTRSAGSWSGMVKQVREFILQSDSDLGALTKYVKTITTGSLNTFAGEYIAAITADLGFDWFMYVGAIIKTSRAWCIACIEKKYIHRSEFAALLHGDFPEFKAHQGKIYPKTGLPSGLDEGTTVFNLQVRCGGRLSNCNHQMLPVSAAVVPKHLRDKFI